MTHTPQGPLRSAALPPKGAAPVRIGEPSKGTPRDPGRGSKRAALRDLRVHVRGLRHVHFPTHRGPVAEVPVVGEGVVARVRGYRLGLDPAPAPDGAALKRSVNVMILFVM